MIHEIRMSIEVVLGIFPHLPVLAVTKVSNAIIEVAPSIVFLGLSDGCVIECQRVQSGCIMIHNVNALTVAVTTICSIFASLDSLM